MRSYPPQYLRSSTHLNPSPSLFLFFPFFSSPPVSLISLLLSTPFLFVLSLFLLSFFPDHPSFFVVLSIFLQSFYFFFKIFNFFKLCIFDHSCLLKHNTLGQFWAQQGSQRLHRYPHHLSDRPGPLQDSSDFFGISPELFQYQGSDAIEDINVSSYHVQTGRPDVCLFVSFCSSRTLVRTKIIRDILEAMSCRQLAVASSVTFFEQQLLDTIFTSLRL